MMHILLLLLLLLLLLSTQEHLQFYIRYINNSLPTRKNMVRWDYHKVLIAPFVLILNHSFMLSLVVNSTLIALPGDTTQSLTSLPSHFNL